MCNDREPSSIGLFSHHFKFTPSKRSFPGGSSLCSATGCHDLDHGHSDLCALPVCSTISSGVSTFPPRSYAWPPVGVNGGPERKRRGPSRTLSCIASGSWKRIRPGAPRSRSVVIPARSAFRQFSTATRRKRSLELLSMYPSPQLSSPGKTR